MENLLHGLKRRGLVPFHGPCMCERCAQIQRGDKTRRCHYGIGWQTILDVFKDIARQMENGAAHRITEEGIAERVGNSAREVRRVLAWAKRVGWLYYWNRFRASDRLPSDDGCPSTPWRNNAYLLRAVPPSLAAQLSDEELIDLMGYGRAKAVIEGADLGVYFRAKEDEEQEVDPDLDAFLRIFRELHRAKYPHAEGHGRIKKESQAKIATQVSERVGEARAYGQRIGLQLDHSALRDDLCRRMIGAWLDDPGHKGYLAEKKHPIGCITSDLDKIGKAAVEEWKKAQKKPRQRPLSPEVASVIGPPGPAPDASEAEDTAAPPSRRVVDPSGEAAYFRGLPLPGRPLQRAPALRASEPRGADDARGPPE